MPRILQWFMSAGTIPRSRSWPVLHIIAATRFRWSRETATATEEFGLIAGPGGDGTLFIFIADPRRNREAAPVVERFRGQNFEHGSTRCSATAPPRSGHKRLKKPAL